MIAGGTYRLAVTCALNVTSTSAASGAGPALLRRASFLKGLVMPLGDAASVEGGVAGCPSHSAGETILGVAACKESLGGEVCAFSVVASSLLLAEDVSDPGTARLSVLLGAIANVAGGVSVQRELSTPLTGLLEAFCRCAAGC